MAERKIDPKFNIHKEYRKMFIMNPYRGSVGLLPQTQAILDRADSLGFTKPNPSTITAMDTYIGKKIANGTMWSGTDTFANFEYNDINCANFSRINWRNPNGDLYTIHGGMTYTVNGWKGNGIDGYMNTKYIPSTVGNKLTLSSIGITHGLFNDFPNGIELMGVHQRPSNRRIALWTNAPSVTNGFYANDYSDTSLGAQITSKRIITFGRDGSIKYFNNNGTQFSATATAEVEITLPYFIGAMNNNGSPKFYTSGTSQFFRAGSLITSAMSTQEKVDRNEYLTAIGLATIS